MHLLLLLVGLFAATASAAVIDVYPGPGTPLQDAIDGASPGDAIRVHDGDYFENISIDKPLRIRGIDTYVGNIPNVSIRGDCGSSSAIAVNADDVSITNVYVFGGALHAIDITGRDRVVLRASWVQPAYPSCGTESGLVNVFQSNRVRLVGNHMSSGIGIRIGGTPVGAKVLAAGNNVGSNAVGIIVDDSPLGSNVLVRGNLLQNNTDGILLDNAHGARIVRNRVAGSFNNGIWANATSTKNGIFRNQIQYSGNLDVVDDSNDNCWVGNIFGTGTPNTNGC
jgi:nitrous oxidase accessory protein